MYYLCLVLQKMVEFNYKIVNIPFKIVNCGEPKIFLKLFIMVYFTIIDSYYRIIFYFTIL